MSQVATKHTDNFYFQIILNRLIPQNTQFSQQKIKFSINRGKQIFDETKILSYQIVNDCIPLNRIRLNFIIFMYDPQKSHQFSLKLHEVHGEEQKCIGEYILDSNAYVNEFLQSNKSAFQEQVRFNIGHHVQIQLYLERSRYSLQKLIRETNNPKSKIRQEAGSPKFHRIKQNRSRPRDPSVSPRKSRQNPFKKGSPKKERLQLTSEPLVSSQNPTIQRQQKEQKKAQVIEQVKSIDNKIEDTIQQLQPVKNEQPQFIQQHPISEPLNISQAKPQQVQNPRQAKQQVVIQQVNLTLEQPQPQFSNEEWQVLKQETLPPVIAQQIKQQVVTQENINQQVAVVQEIKAQVIQQSLPQQTKTCEFKQQQNIKELSFQKQQIVQQLQQPLFQEKNQKDGLEISVKRQFSMQFKAGFIIFLIIILFASIFVQEQQQQPIIPPKQQIKENILATKKPNIQKPKKAQKKSLGPVSKSKRTK